MLCSIVDKKHNVTLPKLFKMIRDSCNFGYRGSSTRNSINWTFCMKCIERGEKFYLEEGKFPKCGYSKKKIAKLSPKSIQMAKYNFVNDVLFYVILSILGRIHEQHHKFN